MKKDWDYYKTVMDIYLKVNDVYGKFGIKRIEELDRVMLLWEPDFGECFLMESEDKKYQVVQAGTSFRWVGTRIMLRDVGGVDINMPKLLHDVEQEDHRGRRCRMFVFDYVEGESLGEYLTRVGSDKAYELGLDLGRGIRRLHSAKIEQYYHARPWRDAHRNTYHQNIVKYTEDHISEAAFELYRDNINVLDNYDRASRYVYENGVGKTIELLALINGDVRPELMTVRDGRIYLKCAMNVRVADPYYEFRFLSLLAEIDGELATGVVHGYFEGREIPEEFFVMLRIYSAELLVAEGGALINREDAKAINEFYDGFKALIPSWYRTPESKTEGDGI